MANLNFSKVVLGGRLTSDPELKATPTQVAVAPLTIAVNNPGKDAGTSFINCVAWRKTAEFITRYFKKGSSILVEGTLNQRSYTDKDGNKRSATEVTVTSAYFVDGRDDAKTEAPQISAADATQFEELSGNEDLPF